MKSILLFGAGKSATVLIDYFIEYAEKEQWHLTVADANEALAQSKTGSSAFATTTSFDINDNEERRKCIEKADIVISLLPPSLHILVAKDCLLLRKNLLTASYADNEIKELEYKIKESGLLFLYEMGLDPGIDHMSAMKLIELIRKSGGRITSFISHCGGLVAPESDNNPWHYKISWNPRNIVLAGKAGAVYKENSNIISLPYEEIFSSLHTVAIPDLGTLAWYPNRDSISYTQLYGLEETDTFIRTTLRHPNFIDGWQNVIELKLTDETPAYNSNEKSLQALFKEHLEKNNSFLAADKEGNLQEISNEKLKIEGAEHVYNSLQKENLSLNQLFYLGLNDNDTLVNKGEISPADLLQFALEKKLSLAANDRDMIVMLHEIEYEKEEKKKKISSSLIVKGQDALRTAMAKTVGLPLGIAAKLILSGSINMTGLVIPTHPKIYEQVLPELEALGIQFKENEES